MKYNEGDKVQIRSDLVGGKTYGKYKTFSDVMDHLGKEVTIDKVYERAGYYGFEGAVGRGFLTDEMIAEEKEEVVSVAEEEVTKVNVRYNETVNMWMNMYDRRTFRIIMKNHIATLVQQYDKTGGLGDLEEAIEYTNMLKEWELSD